MKNPPHESRLTRRDFLASSTLAAASMTMGFPRATIAAAEPAKRAPAGAEIDNIVIFPAIGISRVGNSTKYFLAPEVPGVPPNPGESFKDGNDMVKKQVQRFRVYGFDKKGRVVRELTASQGDAISWTVHVANSKGAWYEFNSPMDMGKQTPGLTGQMRNQAFAGKAREKLIIDPGPANIGGKTKDPAKNPPVKMVGTFWVEPNIQTVTLGELRTDAEGHLLVVPGDAAGGPATPAGSITSFSDNDAYYDDWCDGPVSASVTLNDGRTLNADDAWVTCCGPDWAPEIHSFITLYDVVRDVMVNGKPFAGKKPLEPRLRKNISFLEEIYPLFHRLGQMEWLAEASQLREAWIDVRSFLNEDYIRRLANPSKENKSFREKIFGMFRDPDNERIEQYKLPFMLGSGAGYDFSPAHWFLMPKLQYEILRKWAKGEFIDDYDRPESQARTIEDVPLEHQPHALTRAALEPCSGGAFHPGVEMTWPLRQEALFRDDLPYRIARGNRKSLLQNDVVGRLMTPETAFNRKEVLNGNPKHRSGEAYTFVPGDNAPIGPQMPGDLTRWMGLPWYGDAFSCGLAVEYSQDFPLAIWWPALTPIDVLPERYYQEMINESQRLHPSDAVIVKYFEKRQPWVRGVRGIGLHVEASYIDGLARAVHLWNRFGFIVSRPRPKNLSAELQKIIPETIFVEVDRGSMDLMTATPNKRGEDTEAIEENDDGGRRP